jgi:hypothetical protein
LQQTGNGPTIYLIKNGKLFNLNEMKEELKENSLFVNREIELNN